MTSKRFDLGCSECALHRAWSESSATRGRGVDAEALELVRDAWAMRSALGSLAHGIGPVRIPALCELGEGYQIDLLWLYRHAHHRPELVDDGRALVSFP